MSPSTTLAFADFPSPRSPRVRVRALTVLVLATVLCLSCTAVGATRSSAVAPVQLLVSASADRSAPVALDGATVAGPLYAFVTPEAALVARQQGSVAALRRILGGLADGPRVARAAELATKAAASAPIEGRVMYAALRTLPVPDEPLARLWHATTLLREHRGDGHIAALITERIGGTESHVLHALWEGMPAEKSGRVSHLPATQLAAVVEGMRARGLIDGSGRLSDAGRATKKRIESTTDDLAEPAYETLRSDERDQLIEDLEPLAATLAAAGSA